MKEITAFSALVRSRRRELGMTIAELAAQVGYDPSYISLVERGQRRIEDEAVVRIALVLGLDPSTALLGALRERLPAEMKRYVAVPPAKGAVPKSAAPAPSDHGGVREFQAGDFDFEIDRMRTSAVTDWDGNARITRTIEGCRPNASGRPVGEIAFNERVVGSENSRATPAPSFRLDHAPAGLEYEVKSHLTPTGYQHVIRFPRGWRRTSQKREDAFSFSFESYQERAFGLDLSDHVKKAEIAGLRLRLPLKGTLGHYVRHLVRRLEVSVGFPNGYVPEGWEAWAWWGNGALEPATRNVIDRIARGYKLRARKQNANAELTVEEPLAGYTVAVVWTPLDSQRYLEARYGGSR